MPTYGNILLRQDENGAFTTARRAPLGFTDDRNEDWLRDLDYARLVDFTSDDECRG